MLRFDIITIFPEFFREAIDCGILRRARNAGLVEVTAHDLRQWTTDKHHVVDDRPFGGGDGMILETRADLRRGRSFNRSFAKRRLSDGNARDFVVGPGSGLFASAGPGDLARTLHMIVLHLWALRRSGRKSRRSIGH